MHRVHSNNDYIVLLNDAEILNPFAALAKILKKFRSVERASDELYEILIASFRSGQWKKHESPLLLYKKFRHIIKLIEVAWLINKNRNGLFSDDLIPAYASFQGGEEKSLCIQDEFSSALLNLEKIFCSNTMCVLKSVLYEFFLLGLEPSDIEHLDLELQNVEVFRSIDELINTVYKLHELSSALQGPIFNRSKWDEYLKEHKMRDTIYDYDYGLDEIFYLTSKDKLLSGISISIEILNAEGYWKSHEHPGNIIPLFYEYLFLIDEFWRTWLGALEAKIDLSVPWKYPKNVQKSLKSIKRLNLTHAWTFLANKFAKKDITYWYKLWEGCLQTQLSDSPCPQRKMRSYCSMLELIEGMIHLSELVCFMSWEDPFDEETYL